MANQSCKDRTGHSGIATALVATGILLSRIAGLVRERVFAHFFGNTMAADAFRAAIRIPNFLQNLFGEGVLSASFIPVYSQLLQRRQTEQAKALANAVAGIMGLLISILVLVGLVAAPILTDLFAPGFAGQKRQLTITLVRILFPGTGILVLSSLCLGILNSHGRFFLSYAAPVLWNLAIIASLIYLGPRTELPALAAFTAWGAVIGSILQIGIQLPHAIRLASLYRPSLSFRTQGVRDVLTNAIPVTISRGIVQVSGYIDSIIASFLPTGAVSALGYAQTLYLLPVSLFGMSVSAAELPALSRETGQAERQLEQVRARLQAGIRRILLLIAPSVSGLVGLGDVVVCAIYRSGRFGPDDARYVWAILAVACIGLPASTLSRLYCAAFYAHKDTRTPLRYAVIRVLTSTLLAILLAIYLPKILRLA
ncbi:MAG: murein biosynthesis integral membrane protein MurJ, partial [Sedimentisphaerales bacterium]|nr:murein biosynthesis integral membrane protein MurJ [Sedimentisphaerales bacterium]